MYFISEIKLYNKIYKREREREGEQGEREGEEGRGRGEERSPWSLNHKFIYLFEIDTLPPASPLSLSSPSSV